MAARQVNYHIVISDDFTELSSRISPLEKSPKRINQYQKQHPPRKRPLILSQTSTVQGNCLHRKKLV